MPVPLNVAAIQVIALAVGLFLTTIALLFIFALAKKKDGGEW